MKIRNLVITFSLLLFFSATAFAQRFDIDSDDLDELMLINIDQDNRLDWQVLSSASGYLESIAVEEDFGKAGDNLIPGKWGIEDEVDLGFASSKDKQIEWTITGSSNVSIVSGRSRDVHGAGDLNSDGTWDIFTIEPKGQTQILFSPFLASINRPNPSIINSVKFSARAASKMRGKNGRAGIIYGIDNSDEIAILYSSPIRNRKNIRALSRYTIEARDEENNTRDIKLNTLPAGSVASFTGFTLSDDTKGFMVHEKLNNNRLRVRLFNATGTLLFSKSYKGDTVVVGRFLADTQGDQFAVKSRENLTIVEPFSNGEKTRINIGQGVIADSFNVNFFKGESSGGGLTKVCPKTSTFGAGRLWKPDSDVTDNRGGKPVLLFTGSNKGDRAPKKVYDSKGNIICSGMTFKAGEPGINNGADHFYSGWIGGCSLTADEMAAKARAKTGKNNVFVEWKDKTCLSLADPHQRAGSL